jgi:hypothetical protein
MLYWQVFEMLLNLGHENYFPQEASPIKGLASINDLELQRPNSRPSWLNLTF